MARSESRVSWGVSSSFGLKAALGGDDFVLNDIRNSSSVIAVLREGSLA